MYQEEIRIQLTPYAEERYRLVSSVEYFVSKEAIQNAKINVREMMKMDSLRQIVETSDVTEMPLIFRHLKLEENQYREHYCWLLFRRVS